MECIEPELVTSVSFFYLSLSDNKRFNLKKITQSTAFEQEYFHRSHSLFRAFGYYKDVIVEPIIPAGYSLLLQLSINYH